MTKKGCFSLCLMLLMLLTVTFSSVSAQDADLSNMNNAQLIQLLQEIMLKLGSDEPENAETPEPTMTPTPIAALGSDPLAEYDDEQLLLLLQMITDRLDTAEKTPEPGNDAVRYEIYEIKKLIIEKLPDHMFIQKDPETDEPGKNEKENKGTPVPGTVCDPKFPNFCFWTWRDGNVVCVCSELG